MYPVLKALFDICPANVSTIIMIINIFLQKNAYILIVSMCQGLIVGFFLCCCLLHFMNAIVDITCILAKNAPPQKNQLNLYLLPGASILRGRGPCPSGPNNKGDEIGHASSDFHMLFISMQARY